MERDSKGPEGQENVDLGIEDNVTAFAHGRNN